MSEFVAEAASKYVEASTAEPDEIELAGRGPKRIFKGHTLYWSAVGAVETGVFLTAKRRIAYWSFSPLDDEVFEVYDSLEELWEEQHRIKPRVKASIQREYVELTKESIVERLDI